MQIQFLFYAKRGIQIVAETWKCVLCDKAINVEYGCGAALKSHSASKAHKDNVKKVSDA